MSAIAADREVEHAYAELVNHMAKHTGTHWTKEEAADALADNPRIQEDYYNAVSEKEES